MTMTVLELLDHTRNEVLRDMVGPYLFSDEALLRYMNEGYKQFARHTHCFIDEMETIETVAGTARYGLPADTIYLRQVGYESRWLSPFSRRAKPNKILRGPPLGYTTDAAQRNMKLYPVPDDVYTLDLERAIEPPTVDQSSTIELQFDYAILLAQWIAYRALMTNDPDGSNTIDARSFHQSWGMGLREAKMDFTRQAMGDNPSAQPRKWT